MPPPFFVRSCCSAPAAVAVIFTDRARIFAQLLILVVPHMCARSQALGRKICKGRVHTVYIPPHMHYPVPLVLRSLCSTSALDSLILSSGARSLTLPLVMASLPMPLHRLIYQYVMRWPAAALAPFRLCAL